MIERGIFYNMATLNKVAISFFITAKLFGMTGVCLGFADNKYHTVGGYLLSFAFVFIFFAVLCSIIQTSIDKKKFELEDSATSKTKKLAQMKAELEREIKDLEDRRDALQKIILRK